MARILHLTDLHVTEHGSTLESLWTGPKAYLSRAKFDFIVVSGDLSQRASPEEYEELLKFTEQDLLPLLSQPTERERVVFVPGNHDASWSTSEAYSRISLASTSHDEIQKRITELREAPEEATSRIHIGNHGHLELYKVDPSSNDYRRRFSNVQTFFDRFYQSSLDRTGCKRFDLHASSQDWSSHLFADERLVFIGLSSCFRNDRYWHGASFDPKSIAAISRHLDNLRRETSDLMVVAVWHHGFSSTAGRPDRLMPSELGNLFNLGVSVGFHGHTHSEDLTQYSFLRGKLAVIATGSFGAGDADRPAAAKNQLSVVDLFPSRLHLRRVNRAHLSINANVYDGEKPERIDIPRGGKIIELDKPWIDRHYRTWIIDEDGNAVVTVQMEGIETSRPIVLALVNPPYCTIKGKELAETATKSIAVIKKAFRDGRTRFTLGENCSSSSLLWEYSISNAFALTREELALVPERKPDFPNIDADKHDVRSHTVRYDCDELVICVELPEHLFGTWSIQVERPTPDGSDTSWELAPAEAVRCDLKKEESPSQPNAWRAKLTVRGPIVGYRYSLVSTRPSAHGAAPLDDQTKNLLRRLHEIIRLRLQDSVALPATLTKDCSRALLKSLGFDEPVSLGAWMALLWEQESRRIVPAFGCFPPRSWATRFHAGYGVAGHCFRHAKCVAWSVDTDRDSLIYQGQERGREFSTSYASVIAIPILASPSSAVGVICFARTKNDNEIVDDLIHDLATSADTEQFAKLLSAANTAFWETVANSHEVSVALRKRASAILESLAPE